MPVLHLETRIAAPVDRCFDLSLSIDAHSESMAGSRERAVAGVTSGRIGPGESVTWQARHFGLPVRMTSVIGDYERPVRFVDEQTRGPFKRWWHEHLFFDEGGGTLMVDRIEFEAPLGPLGRFVERAILARYMRRLIESRNRWLAETLES